MTTANIQGQSNVIDLISDAEEESEDEPVIDLTEEENAPQSQRPPPVVVQEKVTKAASPVKKPHVITVNYQSQPAMGKFTKTLVSTTASTINKVTYQNKPAAENQVVNKSQPSPEKQIVQKSQTDQQHTATKTYSRPKIVYDTEINNIDLTEDDVEEPSPKPAQAAQTNFTVTRKYVQLTKETVLQKVLKNNHAAAATAALQPGIRLNQETVLHPMTKKNIAVKKDVVLPKFVTKSLAVPAAKKNTLVQVKGTATTIPVKGTVTTVPMKGMVTTVPMMVPVKATVAKPTSKPQNRLQNKPQNKLQNKPLSRFQNEEKSTKLKMTAQSSSGIQEIGQARDVLEIGSPPQLVQQQTGASQSLPQDINAGAPQNQQTGHASSISAPSFNVSAGGAAAAVFPPNIGQPNVGQANMGQGQNIFVLPTNSGSNVQVLPLQFLSALQNSSNNNQQQIFLISMPNMNPNNGPAAGGAPQFIALPQNFMSAYTNNSDGSQQPQQMSFIPVVSTNSSASTISQNYNNNSDVPQQPQEMNSIPMVAVNSAPTTHMNQAPSKGNAKVEVATQRAPPSAPQKNPPKRSNPTNVFIDDDSAVVKVFPQKEVPSDKSSAEDCIPLFMCSKDAKKPDETEGEEEVLRKQPASKRKYTRTNVVRSKKQFGLPPADNASTNPSIGQVLFNTNLQPQQQQQQQHMPGVPQMLPGTSISRSNRELVGSGFGASSVPTRNFPRFCQPNEAQVEAQMRPVSYTTDVDPLAFDSTLEWVHNRPSPQYPPVLRPGERVTPISVAITTNVNNPPMRSVDTLEQVRLPNDPLNTTNTVNRSQPAGNFVDINALDDPSDPLNLDNSEYSEDLDKIRYVIVRDQDGRITGVRSVVKTITNNVMQSNTMSLLDQVYPTPSSTPVAQPRKIAEADQETLANDNLIKLTLPPPLANISQPDKIFSKEMREHNYSSKHPEPDLTFIRDYKNDATVIRRGRKPKYRSSTPDVRFSTTPEIRPECSDPLDVSVTENPAPLNLRRTSDPLRLDDSSTNECDPLIDEVTTEGDRRKKKVKRKTDDRLNVSEAAFETQFQKNLQTMIFHQEITKQKELPPGGTDSGNEQSDLRNSNFMSEITNFKKHMPKSNLKKKVSPETNRHSSDSATLSSDSTDVLLAKRRSNDARQTSSRKGMHSKSQKQKDSLAEENEENATKPVKSSNKTSGTEINKEETTLKRKRGRPFGKRRKTVIDVIPEMNKRKPGRPSSRLGRASNAASETYKDSRILQRKPGRITIKLSKTYKDDSNAEIDKDDVPLLKRKFEDVSNKEIDKDDVPLLKRKVKDVSSKEIDKDDVPLLKRKVKDVSSKEIDKDDVPILKRKVKDVSNKEIDKDDVPILKRKSDTSSSSRKKSNKNVPDTESDMCEPVVKRKRGRPPGGCNKPKTCEPVKFIRRTKRILRNKTHHKTIKPTTDPDWPPLSSQLIKSTNTVESTKPVREIITKASSEASPVKSSYKTKFEDEEYFQGFTSVEINTSLLYSKKIASATRHEFSIAVESTTKSALCGDYCRKRLRYFSRKASVYEKKLGIKRGRGRKQKMERKMKERMEYYGELRDALCKVDKFGRPSVFRYPVLRHNMLRTSDREERKSRNNVIIRLQSKRRFKKKGEPRNRTRDKADQDPDYKNAVIKQKLEEHVDSKPVKKHKGQTEKYVKNILEENPESVTEAMTVQLLKPVAIMIEKLQVDASTHETDRTETTMESLQSMSETVENRTIKTEIMDDEEIANDESNIETMENEAMSMVTIKTETLDIETDENPLMNIDADENTDDTDENPLMNIAIVKTETVSIETFEDETMNSEALQNEAASFETVQHEAVSSEIIQSGTRHIHSFETVSSEALQNGTVQHDSVSSETVQSETMQTQSIETVHELLQDETIGSEKVQDETTSTETIQSETIHIQSIETVNETLQNETLGSETVHRETMSTETIQNETTHIASVETMNETLQSETVDSETVQYETMDTETIHSGTMHIESVETVNDTLQSGTIQIHSVETMNETLQNETLDLETVQHETIGTETIQSETMHIESVETVQIQTVETVNDTLEKETENSEIVQHEPMGTETIQSETMHVESVETVNETLHNETVDLGTVQHETMATETIQSKTMHIESVETVQIQSVETVNDTLQNETENSETVQREPMGTETIQSDTIHVESVETVNETLHNETVDLETVQHETMATETIQSKTMHIESVETVNETPQSETVQIQSVETVNETLHNETVDLETVQHEIISSETMHIESVETVDETLQSETVQIQSVETVNETLHNETVDLETVHNEATVTEIMNTESVETPNETFQSETVQTQSAETVNETLQNETVDSETVQPETMSIGTIQSETMHIESVETVNETLESETVQIQSVETVNETLQNETVDSETVQPETVSTETIQSGPMRIESVETSNETLQGGIMEIHSVETENEPLQNETVDSETIPYETMGPETTQSETMHIESVERVNETPQSETVQIQSVETVNESLQDEAIDLETVQHEALGTETIQSETMLDECVETVNETLRSRTVDLDTVQHETAGTETIQSETVHTESVQTMNEPLQSETIQIQSAETVDETLLNRTVDSDTVQRETTDTETIQSETMHTESIQTVNEPLQSDTIQIRSAETVDETLQNRTVDLDTVQHETTGTETIHSETMHIHPVETVNETLQNETVQHETMNSETVRSEIMHIHSVETVNTETVQTETMTIERVGNETEPTNSNTDNPNEVVRNDEDDDTDDYESLFVVKRVEIIKPGQTSHRNKRGRRRTFF